jgi:regulator of chromosome condensation
VQGLGHFRTTRVAAGDSFSVCLSDSGDIRQFGSFRSSDGLLGNAIAFEPFKPSIPNKVSQVAAGMDFLLALDVAGNVWASGNAQQGQLGRKILERRKENGLVPQRLALKKAVYVAAGEFNGYAV